MLVWISSVSKRTFHGGLTDLKYEPRTVEHVCGGLAEGGVGRAYKQTFVRYYLLLFQGRAPGWDINGLYYKRIGSWMFSQVA